MIYRYDKKLLVPVLPSQVEEVLTSFKGCKIGRKYISIDFEDHNYKCMSYLESVMDSKVQALSFFSGCGGLDIGAQMAGAKILTSLDFDKDAVNTLSHNEFFSHTIHR